MLGATEAGAASGGPPVESSDAPMVAFDGNEVDPRAPFPLWSFFAGGPFVLSDLLGSMSGEHREMAHWSSATGKKGRGAAGFSKVTGAKVALRERSKALSSNGESIFFLPKCLARIAGEGGEKNPEASEATGA